MYLGRHGRSQWVHPCAELAGAGGGDWAGIDAIGDNLRRLAPGGAGGMEHTG